MESAYCTDVNLTERRVFCSSLNHYMTALQLAVVEYMYTCVLKNILYICSGGGNRRTTQRTALFSRRLHRHRASSTETCTCRLHLSLWPQSSVKEQLSPTVLPRGHNQPSNNNSLTGRSTVTSGTHHTGWFSLSLSLRMASSLSSRMAGPLSQSSRMALSLSLVECLVLSSRMSGPVSSKISGSL